MSSVDNQEGEFTEVHRKRKKRKTWEQRFLQVMIMTITILELFTILISKCRQFTPEPRSQATNRETWIRAIIQVI